MGDWRTWDIADRPITSCGAAPVCVCTYVPVCLCICVYLCVCVYCIGAEAAHAYLLVTHTQPAQRETDAETPAANFLIKGPLPLPYSTYIGFNPFPRLAPPNVTVQSLLPPPPCQRSNATCPLSINFNISPSMGSNC